eukprot:389956-Ditylum_brightwellii.AAC.1
MDISTHLQELFHHFSIDYVLAMIVRHKESGKEDGGQGSTFFDQGKASAMSQCRSQRFHGLSTPIDQKVDDNMTLDEIIFCNTTESLIYNAMKDLMPKQ